MKDILKNLTGSKENSDKGKGKEDNDKSKEDSDNQSPWNKEKRRKPWMFTKKPQDRNNDHNTESPSEGFKSDREERMQEAREAWKREQRQKNREKIIQELGRYKLDASEITQIEDTIKRAKQGLERLQKSYEDGSPEWQDLLTSKTRLGRELRVMFLGLKPMVGLNQNNEEFLPLCQKHAKGNFHDVSLPCGPKIFIEDSVKKVLAEKPEIFDDYTPGSSVSDYISKIYDSWQSAWESEGKSEKTANFERKTTQRLGYLYGYPPNAVDRISMYPTHLTTKEQLSNDERDIIKNYWDPKTANKFRDEHQSEIRTLLQQKFPEIKGDEAEHIVSRRNHTFLGIDYVTDDIQNPRDQYYHAKAKYIIHTLGLDENLDFLHPYTES